MDSSIVDGMSVLREVLRSAVQDLRRHTPSEARRISRQAGVYVFFGGPDGQILKVGSSVNVQSRTRSQVGKIVEWVAAEVARWDGTQIYEKCSECNVQKHDYTKEFLGLLTSLTSTLRIGFFPEALIKKFGMGIRQFEGLTIWAVKPRLNSKNLEYLGNLRD